MPPKRSCASQTGPEFSLGHSPSPRPRHWSAAVQSCVAQVCRSNGLRPCNSCNYMDYCTFSDPARMEDWVGLVTQVESRIEYLIPTDMIIVLCWYFNLTINKSNLIGGCLKIRFNTIECIVNWWMVWIMGTGNHNPNIGGSTISLFSTPYRTTQPGHPPWVVAMIIVAMVSVTAGEKTASSA